jgi:hypothetical protein
MAGFKNPEFSDRISAAANAKKSLLEKFQARPKADDPEVAAKLAARQASRAARDQRLAARKAEREAAEAARRAAEQAGGRGGEDPLEAEERRGLERERLMLAEQKAARMRVAPPHGAQDALIPATPPDSVVCLAIPD